MASVDNYFNVNLDGDADASEEIDTSVHVWSEMKSLLRNSFTGHTTNRNQGAATISPYDNKSDNAEFATELERFQDIDIYNTMGLNLEKKFRFSTLKPTDDMDDITAMIQAAEISTPKNPNSSSAESIFNETHLTEQQNDLVIESAVVVEDDHDEEDDRSTSGIIRSASNDSSYSISSSGDRRGRNRGIWTGGEGLSTNKLSMMLSDMQGRLKDGPSNSDNESRASYSGSRSLRVSAPGALYQILSEEGVEHGEVVVSTAPYYDNVRPYYDQQPVGYTDGSGGVVEPNLEVKSIRRGGRITKGDAPDEVSSVTSSLSNSSAGSRYRTPQGQYRSAPISGGNAVGDSSMLTAANIARNAAVLQAATLSVGSPVPSNTKSRSMTPTSLQVANRSSSRSTPAVNTTGRSVTPAGTSSRAPLGRSLPVSKPDSRGAPSATTTRKSLDSSGVSSRPPETPRNAAYGSRSATPTPRLTGTSRTTPPVVTGSRVTTPTASRLAALAASGRSTTPTSTRTTTPTASRVSGTSRSSTSTTGTKPSSTSRSTTPTGLSIKAPVPSRSTTPTNVSRSSTSLATSRTSLDGVPSSSRKPYSSATTTPVAASTSRNRSGTTPSVTTPTVTAAQRRAAAAAAVPSVTPPRSAKPVAATSSSRTSLGSVTTPVRSNPTTPVQPKAVGITSTPSTGIKKPVAVNPTSTSRTSLSKSGGDSASAPTRTKTLPKSNGAPPPPVSASRSRQSSVSPVRTTTTAPTTPGRQSMSPTRVSSAPLPSPRKRSNSLERSLEVLTSDSIPTDISVNSVPIEATVLSPASNMSSYQVLLNSVQFVPSATLINVANAAIYMPSLKHSSQTVISAMYLSADATAVSNSKNKSNDGEEVNTIEEAVSIVEATDAEGESVGVILKDAKSDSPLSVELLDDHLNDDLNENTLIDEPLRCESPSKVTLQLTKKASNKTDKGDAQKENGGVSRPPNSILKSSTTLVSNDGQQQNSLNRSASIRSDKTAAVSNNGAENGHQADVLTSSRPLLNGRTYQSLYQVNNITAALKELSKSTSLANINQALAVSTSTAAAQSSVEQNGLLPSPRSTEQKLSTVMDTILPVGDGEHSNGVDEVEFKKNDTTIGDSNCPDETEVKLDLLDCTLVEEEGDEDSDVPADE